jgi:sarcosine oxidase subunit beta
VLSDSNFSRHYDEAGYVFLAGVEQIEPLRRAWKLQQDMGVAVRWLDPAQLRELVPYCELRGVVGGTFGSEDGFIDPSDVVQWLLAQCRERGVTILKHTPIDAFEISNKRVRAIRSGTMRLEADIVVNAAGAWAGCIGTLAGVTVPVDPSPRVKYLTEGVGLPTNTPLIVDLPTGAYVRSHRGRALLGVKPETRLVSFHADSNQELLVWMAERVCKRFPTLRDAEVRGLIKGLYELTPDGLPLAGVTGEVAGLYVCAGFNGHGIMHGPGVAGALAELIVTGRSKTLDLGPLRPNRFEHGLPTTSYTFL